MAVTESALTNPIKIGSHLLPQTKDGMLTSAMAVYDEVRQQSVQETLDELAANGGGGGSGDDAVKDVKVNGTSVVDNNGEANITAVKDVKVNGASAVDNNGEAIISVPVKGVKVNGASVVDNNGDAIISVPVKGVKVEGNSVVDNNGDANITFPVKGVKVNGSSVIDSNGDANITAVKGVKVNGSSVVDNNGEAIISVPVKGVKVEGNSVVDNNGDANITFPVKGVKVNGASVVDNNGDANIAVPSIAGLATETYVDEQIAQAQIGGGEVDLSTYATKAYADHDRVRITQDYIDSLEAENYIGFMPGSGDANFTLYQIANGHYLLAEDIDLEGKRLLINPGVQIDLNGHTITNGRLQLLQDPSVVFVNAYRSFTTTLTFFAEKGGTVNFDWWQFEEWTDSDYTTFCRTVFQLKDDEYVPTSVAYDNWKTYYKAHSSDYDKSLYAALREETTVNPFAGEQSASTYYQGLNRASTTNNTIIRCIVEGVIGDRYYGTISNRYGNTQRNGDQMVIKFGRRIYPFKERIKEFYWTQNCKLEGVGRTKTCLAFLDKGIIIENSFIFDISSLCITSIRACISFESHGQHSPGCMSFRELLLIAIRANCVDSPAYLDELEEDNTKIISNVVINKSTFEDIMVVPGAACIAFNNVMSTTAVFNNISDYYKSYKDLYQFSDHAQNEDGSPSSNEAPARPYKALIGFSTVPGNMNNTYRDQCGIIGKISNVAWNYGRKCNYFIWCESQSLAFSELEVSYCHVENNGREQAYFFYTEDVPGKTAENNCRLVLRLIGNRFHGVYDSFEHPLITTSHCILCGDLNNTDLGYTHYVCVQSKNFFNNTPSTIKNTFNATKESECSVVGPNSYLDYKRTFDHQNGTQYVSFEGERNPLRIISNTSARDYFDINLNTLEPILNEAFNENNQNFYTYFGISFPKNNSGLFNICGDTKFSVTDYTADLTNTKRCLGSGWLGMQIGGFGNSSFDMRRNVSIKNDTRFAIRIKSTWNIDGLVDRIYTLLPKATASVDIEKGFMYKFLKGSLDQLTGNEKILFNAHLGKKYYLDFKKNLDSTLQGENNRNKPMVFAVTDMGGCGILFAPSAREANKAYSSQDMTWMNHFINFGNYNYFTKTVNGSEYVYYCVSNGTTGSEEPASYPTSFNAFLVDGTATFVCLGKNGKLSLLSGSGTSNELAGLASLNIGIKWDVAEGATWYNTTTDSPCWYNGTEWSSVSAGSEVPEGVLTVTEADERYQPIGNYLTEHQDISGKADVGHKHTSADITDISDFVTDAELAQATTPVTLNVTTQGGGGSNIDIDEAPTSGSANAVSSGGTYTALAGKSNVGHKHVISDITDLDPSQFGAVSDVKVNNVSVVNSGVANIDTSDFATKSEIQSAGYVTASELSGYATDQELATATTPVTLNVTTQGGGSNISIDETPTQGSTDAVSSGGTYTALAGKANVSHTHTLSEITDFDADDLGKVKDVKVNGTTVLNANGTANIDLSGYALASSLEDYALASALSGKANASHTHTANEITDLNVGITGVKVNNASLTPTAGVVNIDLTGYQSALTFDNAPTAGSDNPVKSKGIKSAIDAATTPVEIEINSESSANFNVVDENYADNVLRESLVPITGSKVIREQNVICNVAHADGWYQFSYPFLTNDTVKVYVDGVETNDFTTLPQGLVHLGSSFTAPYPARIEAEYKLVSKLEQVCSIPFRSNMYGLWYRAYDQLGDSLYLSWDGTCGKFEIVKTLDQNLERAEISLEYASFDNTNLPGSIYDLKCDEFHESFKMYLPKAFHDAAIATLESRWDDHLSSWWQLTEIKFPSALSLSNGGKSFTAYISWRRNGEIYFGARDLDYSTDEHYNEQGYVIPANPHIYFPLDQWVDVEIAVKVGPKGVGYLELKLTDESGNVQYYKENTLDYCPTNIESAGPSSPKSQIDMPKAVSMYMDRYIFDAIQACNAPYWKLKDFYCTFYSHNKD